MSDPAPNPELLRSLGRLVRGLSALFWGLPAALIVCVGTASAGWFPSLGFVPPLAVTGLLYFGLWQLGSFQKQERPWHATLDRAKLLALVNFGLSPFLYWWNRVPEQSFFNLMICVLAVSALLFLSALNVVLLRLGAMLPDETLRLETRQYTALNRNLLIASLVLALAYLFITRVVQVYFSRLPRLQEHLDILSIQIAIPALGVEINSSWLVLLLICFLVLLPLAMTMALVWKIKEVILENVFGAK